MHWLPSSLAPRNTKKVYCTSVSFNFSTCIAQPKQVDEELRQLNIRHKPPIDECLSRPRLAENFGLWAPCCVCVCGMRFFPVNFKQFGDKCFGIQTDSVCARINPEKEWNVDISLRTNGGIPIHNTRLRKTCCLTLTSHSPTTSRKTGPYRAWVACS